MENEKHPNSWERNMLNRLLMASLKEQRAARRWKIFFRLFWTVLIVGYIVFLMAAKNNLTSLRGDGLESTGEHVAVVDIKGTIMAGERASAKEVNRALGNAFKNKNSQAVVLRVNSPGGSPVQAEMIYDEILRLKEKYNKPVYAAIEDMGASAAYYIAAAADEIYVSRSAIVGSIGVLTNQFGFVELMDKLGVERRLVTSGGHKGIMDPFSPLKPGDQEFMEKMLNQIHQTFIAAVKEGRGERLKIDDEVFSGLFWIGQESIDRGLADEIGTVESIARDVVGISRLVEYTPERNFMELFARQLGAGMSETAVELMTQNELAVQ